MTSAALTDWIVTGRDPQHDTRVCEVRTPTTRAVNALFPEREDLDRLTWDYRCVFKAEDSDVILHFPALSPLAEVSLDGEPVEFSAQLYEQSLSLACQPNTIHELSIRFPALSPWLAQRHPRPGWKSAIANNHLRNLRTTFIGQVSGWSDERPFTGVMGVVSMTSANELPAQAVRIFGWAESAECHIEVQLPENFADITYLTAKLNGKDVTLDKQNSGTWLAKVGEQTLWMPHTHGEPNLHELVISATHGDQVYTIKRKLGFRSIEGLDFENRPSFKVNGQSIFVRGACWTHSHVESAEFDESRCRKILARAVELGLNCLRISGPFGYEADGFYQLCDELGLLVWQDFAFANFDYPKSEAFLRCASKEIKFHSDRIAQHPSLLVFCGNSEVEQQAAMLGQTEDAWQHPLFHQTMPEIVAQLPLNIPYTPSSPTGGPVPFSTDQGFSHYFGFGAYKRPESDLALSQVAFASECLGLSHLPSDAFNKQHFQNPTPSTQTAQWKAGVPSDNAVGWDFEDIRDHYVQQYGFGNTAELRHRDIARYHQVGRVVTGHMMRQAFQFWRSPLSPCQGAITWWLNDLAPGAGWGLFDSEGDVKPAGNVLAPALQPVALQLIDQGLNGHQLCWVNETPKDLSGTLTLHAIKTGRGIHERFEHNLTLTANQTGCLSVNTQIGQFLDTTGAYLFAEEPWDVIAASFKRDVLENETGLTLTDVAFPQGLALPTIQQPNHISVTVERTEVNGQAGFQMTSDQLIAFCQLEARGVEFQANHQTVIPGVAWFVPLEGPSAEKAFSLVVTGLNLNFRLRLPVEEWPR